MTLGKANLDIVFNSLVEAGGVEYGLARTEAGPRLAVRGPADSTALAGFRGDRSEMDGKSLLLGPLSPSNAAALRANLPWLQPQPLGTRTSAGMGDRIGLATPGHVRAVRLTGSVIAPIFAQQSIREMTRTGRTPQQVMDDATWGIFAESWQDGVGADAVCQGIDGGKGAAAHFGVRNLDLVFPFDGDHQFQSVDGIEAQPLTKERVAGNDILRLDVFEAQGADHELFEAYHQLAGNVIGCKQ